MRSLRQGNAGYTIVELLMVAGVIAALCGLLLPALGMLRNSQRRVATWDLMQHLGVAVSAYLGDYASVGDAADENAFARDPWAHLSRVPISLGKVPYVELPSRQLALDTGGAGTGPFTGATSETATHPLDSWHRPLLWQIRNVPVPNTPRRYTAVVRIRSDAGTPDPQWRDDLVLEYTSDSKEFSRRKMDDIDAASGDWRTVAP